MGFRADLWTKFTDWISGGGVVVSITVTQAEWDGRNELESDISGRAYAVAGLDWQCYSTFIEDDPTIGKYIFFVNNNLNPKDGTGGVVAAWENDDSMVVGVEVIING